MRFVESSRLLGSIALLALLVGGSLATSACGGTPAADGAKGGLRGTLYVHGSPNPTGRTVYKVDFASGAVTSLVSCMLPDELPDGRILCVDGPDLVTFSPDGTNRRVIVHTVSVVTTGGVYDAFVSNPRMSPDGRFVAYDDDSLTTPSVYIVDATSGKPLVQIGNGVDQLFSHPTWGPDGTLYVQGATYSFNLTPGIFKLDAGFMGIHRIDPGLTGPTTPAVSPDGKKIAFIMNHKVWTMNADGSGARAATSPDLEQDFPVWSPDGSVILASTHNCDLVALDLAGGTFSKVSAQIEGIAGGFGICPDGQMTWR